MTVDVQTPADDPTPPAPPDETPVPDAAAPCQNGASLDKTPLAPSAPLPTQTGPMGLRYDFNNGCRILLPPAQDAQWRVQILDLDTGNILFRTILSSGKVQSAKRYFVRARFEIHLGEQLVLAHDYDASGRKVLINLPVGTLGDTVGWLPYAERFRAAHACHLTCALAKPLMPLFAEAYPDIHFVQISDVDPQVFYATYNLGLFFDDKETIHQPCDFRLVGLHRTAGYILGVDPTETPPRLAIPDGDKRPIAEPYVCIATQATSQAKYWNNPMGWREAILFLKSQGYRVLCVDHDPLHGQGLIWNHLPHGAEDMTSLSLQECARYLKHCDFFVGLSSGLSWLAWAAGARVVMISGFTHPTTEFATPWRVINYHACNSCWNDPALRFDHKDFLWCPRHKDTPRQFECTRLITGAHVQRILKSASDAAKAARSQPIDRPPARRFDARQLLASLPPARPSDRPPPRPAA